MRITVVYFVNVTSTYSSILVKWVSFISGYTNISIRNVIPHSISRAVLF